MRKLYFSLVLMAIGAMCSFAQAQRIDRSHAMEKAKSFVQGRRTAAGSSSATAKRRTAAAKSSTLTDVTMPNDYLYGFNVGNNGGFVIVAADDSASVIGYADEGSLDANNLPDGLKDMLQRMGANVKSAVQGGNTVSLGATSTSTSGANKAARKATAYTTNKAIGPLLTTKWSQFEPYYNLTPDSAGIQTLTCCVATAMAQIVYYLYCTQDGQRSTTFSNGITTGTYQVSGSRTYNWSDMLPSYLNGYTDDQAKAIATLMRDCGYAINAAGGQINYGTKESTAYQYKTPGAYSTYFGVTNVSDTYASTNSTISDASTFFSKIDTELNNYRPVQVCGNGHSFVCDGRAADGVYYHFNFGYGGGGDGFYCAGAYNGYDAYKDMEITYGFTLSNPTSSNTDHANLQVAYNSAIKTMGLRPVGTIAGMYQQSYYDTLKGYLDTAKGVLDGTSSTSDETSLINNIATAEQNLIKYTTPFDSGNNTSGSTYSENGTAYYIRTVKSFNGERYGMATAIDSYDDDSDGNTTEVLTSLWTISSGYAHTFRFFYDSSSNGYWIGNNTLTRYLTSVDNYGADPTWNTYSSNNTLPTSAENTCEVIPVEYLGNGEFAVTIRPMASGYTDDQDRYLCAWSYNSSSQWVCGASDTPAWVYGADPYGEYYSHWILVPRVSSSSTTSTATFDNSSVEIEKGSSNTQTVTTNSTGTITYSSNDITVATVDPSTGEVTGVGVGTATITAAIGGTATYSTSGYTPVVATYTVKVTTPAATLSAPVLAEASKITTSGFSTSWNAVENAESYVLTLTGVQTTSQEVTETKERTVAGITPLIEEDFSGFNKESGTNAFGSKSIGSSGQTAASSDIDEYTTITGWTANALYDSSTNAARFGTTTSSRGTAFMTTPSLTAPSDGNITIAVWASQYKNSDSESMTVSVNDTQIDKFTPSTISTYTKDNATCYIFKTTASGNFTVKVSNADAGKRTIVYYIGVYPGSYDSADAITQAKASQTETYDTTYIKEVITDTKVTTCSTTDTSYTFTGLDNTYKYTCVANAVASDKSNSKDSNTISITLSQADPTIVDVAKKINDVKNGSGSVNDIKTIADKVLKRQ